MKFEQYEVQYENVNRASGDPTWKTVHDGSGNPLRFRNAELAWSFADNARDSSRIGGVPIDDTVRIRVRKVTVQEVYETVPVPVTESPEKKELEKINDILRENGFYYPLGARGVADMANHRRGYLEELRAEFPERFIGAVRVEPVSNPTGKVRTGEKVKKGDNVTFKNLGVVKYGREAMLEGPNGAVYRLIPFGNASAITDLLQGTPYGEES